MAGRLSRWSILAGDNVEGKAMNQAFLRLLAERLEQVPWVDVRLAECTFEESFQGVDGFFMGADLMRFGGTSEVFGFRGWRLGSIAGWAMQLVQEQGGYFGEKSTWIPAPDDVSVYEGDQLVWRALGLGRAGLFEGQFQDFVLDGPTARFPVVAAVPAWSHARNRTGGCGDRIETLRGRHGSPRCLGTGGAGTQEPRLQHASLGSITTVGDGGFRLKGAAGGGGYPPCKRPGPCRGGHHHANRRSCSVAMIRRGHSHQLFPSAGYFSRCPLFLASSHSNSMGCL